VAGIQIDQNAGVPDEAILRVADAAAALSWYERLGYTKEWEHRFEPGLPAFVSLARGGQARLFLRAPWGRQARHSRLPPCR